MERYRKDLMIPWFENKQKGSLPWVANPSDKNKLKNNHIFYTTMALYDYSRGRSSVKFLFKCENTKEKYEMFITDFMRIVPKMEEGKLTGRFAFIKRGANYGVYMVEEEA